MRRGDATRNPDDIEERDIVAMKRPHAIVRWTAGLCCALIGTMAGCKPEDSVLAPYGVGGRALSAIVIEDSVFVPRVTWLGGYVSVFGVSRGPAARLDTSLVWLVYQAGNAIHYPVRLNDLPPGAQNLTTGFGGRPLSRLIEDSRYTFWVLKEDAWAQVSANAGKPIIPDSTLTQPVLLRNDTVFVSTGSFMSRTSLIDVYINITDVNAFGRLVTDRTTFQTYLTVEASDTSNRPVITWKIVQAGITDQRVAAVGMCTGNEYNAFTGVWEMISMDVQTDTTIYWKNNVIGSPIQMGDQVAGTITFKVYPARGLQRGVIYYFWMASKDWDGKARSRVTNNYAYATFTVR